MYNKKNERKIKSEEEKSSSLDDSSEGNSDSSEGKRDSSEGDSDSSEGDSKVSFQSFKRENQNDKNDKKNQKNNSLENRFQFQDSEDHSSESSSDSDINSKSDDSKKSKFSNNSEKNKIRDSQKNNNFIQNIESNNYNNKNKKIKKNENFEKKNISENSSKDQNKIAKEKLEKQNISEGYFNNHKEIPKENLKKKIFQNKNNFINENSEEEIQEIKKEIPKKKKFKKNNFLAMTEKIIKTKYERNFHSKIYIYVLLKEKFKFNLYLEFNNDKYMEPEKIYRKNTNLFFIFKISYKKYLKNFKIFSESKNGDYFYVKQNNKVFKNRKIIYKLNFEKKFNFLFDLNFQKSENSNKIPCEKFEKFNEIIFYYGYFILKNENFYKIMPNFIRQYFSKEIKKKLSVEKLYFDEIFHLVQNKDNIFFYWFFIWFSFLDEISLFKKKLFFNSILKNNGQFKNCNNFWVSSERDVFSKLFHNGLSLILKNFENSKDFDIIIKNFFDQNVYLPNVNKIIRFLSDNFDKRNLSKQIRNFIINFILKKKTYE